MIVFYGGAPRWDGHAGPSFLTGTTRVAGSEKNIAPSGGRMTLFSEHEHGDDILVLFQLVGLTCFVVSIALLGCSALHFGWF